MKKMQISSISINDNKSNMKFEYKLVLVIHNPFVAKIYDPIRFKKTDKNCRSACVLSLTEHFHSTYNCNKNGNEFIEWHLRKELMLKLCSRYRAVNKSLTWTGVILICVHGIATLLHFWMTALHQIIFFFSFENAVKKKTSDTRRMYCIAFINLSEPLLQVWYGN